MSSMFLMATTKTFQRVFEIATKIATIGYTNNGFFSFSLHIFFQKHLNSSFFDMTCFSMP